MNEENENPKVEEASEDEAEATPSKTAPAGKLPGDDDVQAYGEPTDSSGGGK